MLKYRSISTQVKYHVLQQKIHRNDIAQKRPLTALDEKFDSSFVVYCQLPIFCFCKHSQFILLIHLIRTNFSIFSHYVSMINLIFNV